MITPENITDDQIRGLLADTKARNPDTYEATLEKRELIRVCVAAMHSGDPTWKQEYRARCAALINARASEVQP